MSEQNKNTNENSSQTAKHHNKVNKKPDKAVGLIIAVSIAVFVILAVIVGIIWFGDIENDNHISIDGIEYSTNEEGDKYIVQTNQQGEETVIYINDDNISDIKEQILKANHYNVLLVGKDSSSFNTDVFIIASYDVDSGAVSLMQIPRDTYVKILDDKGNPRGNKKVNSLMCDFYYEKGNTGKDVERKAKALEMLKDSFAEILGVPIKYYVYMDLKGFVNIVDAIGGVDMYVPNRMYYSDPEQNLYINLYPGQQTLDGNKAEQFVRFRKGYANADLGRVDAQKLFMKAFIKSVIDKFSVSTIASIAEEVNKNVITNVEINEMIYFAKSALSIDPEKMNMFTIPGDLVGAYYVVSKDATYDCVNQYFNNTKVNLNKSSFDVNGSFYDTVGSRIYAAYSGDKDVVVYSGDKEVYVPVMPIVTTEDVVETTVPEESGTVHTDVSVETTAEPAETTAEPAETTAEPAEITTEPAEITTEPAETTAEPAETTTEPAETTTEPAETTAEPEEITTEPEEITTEPAETTVEPAETTAEPAETTSVLEEGSTEE